jgi:Arc/MetJ-type ribon-helix-helix transcriptional regulator
MTIHPDQQTAAMIQREVDAGRFKDANAVIQTAVRHLVISQAGVGLSREALDASLAAAVEALERGEGADGEQFFAELEREEEEMRRRG